MTLIVVKDLLEDLAKIEIEATAVIYIQQLLCNYKGYIILLATMRRFMPMIGLNIKFNQRHPGRT
jgi:hypothetical protein